MVLVPVPLRPVIKVTLRLKVTDFTVPRSSGSATLLGTVYVFIQQLSRLYWHKNISGIFQLKHGRLPVGILVKSIIDYQKN
jgi:hypothetical protein